MNFASLCSLAGRYDNPIPPRFLAPINSLKMPALTSFTCVSAFFWASVFCEFSGLFLCSDIPPTHPKMHHTPRCWTPANVYLSTYVGRRSAYSRRCVWYNHTVPKLETYIPRNETVRPCSCFLHSCICEQFIHTVYSHDQSSTDRSWEYKNHSQIRACRNWKAEHYNSVLEITRPLSFISENT